MKKGQGLFGHIKDIVITVILIAFLVAFLSVHNWDIVESIQWIIGKCWSIVEKIASIFQHSSGFQKAVS